METAKIQNELLGKGVTFKGYELLKFMKNTFFTPIKGADLQRLRPLVFRESRDVKQAVDELIKAELINANYDKGNISDIFPYVAALMALQDISSGITVTKKVATKKKKADEIPDDVKDILLHYNSHASLPRPSTPTPLVISRIQTKLGIYSPEQIKDALDLAANASWLVNKGSEVWCSAGWVINAIDGFMPGGKYFSSGKNVDTSLDKYKIEDNNTEVFW